MHRRKIYRLLLVASFVFIAFAALVAIHFPYDTDAPMSEVDVKRQIDFYRREYEGSRHDSGTAKGADYVQVAEGMAPDNKRAGTACRGCCPSPSRSGCRQEEMHKR